MLGGFGACRHAVPLLRASGKGWNVIAIALRFLVLLFEIAIGMALVQHSTAFVEYTGVIIGHVLGLGGGKRWGVAEEAVGVEGGGRRANALLP